MILGAEGWATSNRFLCDCEKTLIKVFTLLTGAAAEGAERHVRYRRQRSRRNSSQGLWSQRYVTRLPSTQWLTLAGSFLPARRGISYGFYLCLSVIIGVLSKRQNGSSSFWHTGYPQRILHCIGR